jgi:hypothetical protein
MQGDSVMNTVIFSGPVNVEEVNGAVKGTVGTVPVYASKPELKAKLLELNGKNAVVRAVGSARNSGERYFNNLFLDEVAPADPKVAVGEFFVAGTLEAVRSVRPNLHELVIVTSRNGREFRSVVSTDTDYTAAVGQQVSVYGTVVGRDGRWLDLRASAVLVSAQVAADFPF